MFESVLEAQIILVSTVIAACMCIATAYFYQLRAAKRIEERSEQVEIYVQDMIRSAVQSAIETVNESLKTSLDPILAVNSRAMSMIGNLGAKANQIKMVERQVMEAVNNELPISPDMIEAFSPALAETLRDHPELMPRAMQVFNKIMGDGGISGLPGLNGLPLGPSNRRKHPLREE